jgi:hypothetical protein
MTKKRIALIVAGCLFLCLVVLREIGVIDVNLYRSALAATQTATMGQTTRGEEKHFSYHLAVKSQNETLGSYFHSYNNLPPIEVEATLEEPVYSGNYFLPFAKTFRMTYSCTFSTTTSPSEHAVNGKIQGEVTAKIRGLCSCRKARELAFEEAKKQVLSYLQNQLNL